MHNHIIKIQRYYRSYLIKRKLSLVKDYNLKNIHVDDFNGFTKVIRNKNLIKTVTSLIDSFNNIYQPKNNINARIILTAYLVKKYPDDLLGIIKDRHPLDLQFLEWCNKLVELLDDYKNHTFDDLKKLHNFMINFNIIFNHWKTNDKNRTVQNIIVSYYNRMKHLEYVKDEELEPTQKQNIINTLTRESYSLLGQIRYIDATIDIEYVQNNYELIYENIKKGMDEILKSVSKNFKVSYLQMLIDEFSKSNKKIIYDLMLETNQRLINIAPDKYKQSIINKFNSFDYTKLLITDNWSEDLHSYLLFTIDTVLVYSAPEDDAENVKWQNDMKALITSEYLVSLPVILVEINNKIDKLYSIFNKIF